MTSPAEMLGRTLLGRYRIVLPIGHGGMGTVYLGRTEGAAGFAKPVVIKQILPALVADGGMVQLFIREARILSNLHHPGIVNVLDFGEEGGAYVMVLEYVHGYNLAEWAKYVLTVRERIPVDYLLHIMSHTLDTLQYAHTYKRPDGKALMIIHRDVSPGNVLLDTEGHVKLADFGIARATDDPGEYRSRIGSFKGKLAYSAPELVAGEAASPRSDLYAAGVLLLHLLLGRNPFKGETMAESVQRVLNLRPPPVAAERDDGPLGLDEVLARALTKSPKQRYPDAAAFAEALRKLRQQPEKETAAALAEQLRQDFNSDMSEMLGLKPLPERDGAWRGLEEKLEASLRSTLPPPPRTAGEAAYELAEVGEATVRETTEGQLVARPSATKRRWWPAAAAAGVLLGAAGVAAAVVYSRGQPESGPRYVVIEKNSVPETANQPSSGASLPSKSAATGTTQPARPGDSATPSPKKPPDDGKQPTAGAQKSPGQPDTAALSRAMQRQGGRIQGCFQQHVDKLGGTPQVTLHFRIDAAGKVTSAQLSPAALAGTPLGGCLLSVAKSTSFPPQGKPVPFSIPITARVSR